MILRRVAVTVLVSLLWLMASGGLAGADEPDPGQDDQLSLADLVGYRAALSGKATADDARPSDPPARVGFRDLWERPDAYRGRRVTVRGRVAADLPSGAGGQLPPAAPGLDLLDGRRSVLPGLPNRRPASIRRPECSDEDDAGRMPVARGDDTRPGPHGPIHRHVLEDGPLRGGGRGSSGPVDRGRPPAGTGTRRGGWQSRPRRPVSSPRQRWRASRRRGSRSLGLVAGKLGMGLTLAIIAAGILARQHLREAPLRSRSAMRDRLRDPTAADPPLQFIDHTDDSLV